jgi:hypothetical protein
MIVVSYQQTLSLVTQNDHAHLAAAILELVPALAIEVCAERRATLLRATRWHDNGWQESDAAPLVANGKPLDFTAVPWSERVAVWERGTARYAPSEPAVALLIVEHARTLHRGSEGPEAAALMALLGERRGELCERLGDEAPAVLDLYPWLRLADELSLGLCCRWRRELEHRSQASSWRLRFDGDSVTVTPPALAGTTSFSVLGRRIPDRPYSGTPELTLALVTARWEQRQLRVFS